MVLILDRLQGVRANGRGKHMARCPSHQDKSPSLSIRELDDGRTLIHCFGGCSTVDVLASLGLEMGDLFPERLPDLPRVHGFSAMDALKALRQESGLIAIVAAEIAEGKTISAVDADRVALAASRIAHALQAVHA